MAPSDPGSERVFQKGDFLASQSLAEVLTERKYSRQYGPFFGVRGGPKKLSKSGLKGTEDDGEFLCGQPCFVGPQEEYSRCAEAVHQ